MGSNFLKAASKTVTDVRSFLRESAGGNSIKYVAEKGAKHYIYIPFSSTSVVDPDSGETITTKQIYALQGNIHEWSTTDGKFKAVACMKDIIRHQDENDPNSPLLNDGTCPFCDRVSDAWDIYRFRKELEEQQCQLTGQSRKDHMEKVLGTYADERKAKEAKAYMYMLVVKFKTDANGNPTLGNDKLPEYDLKVMKLSASRVDKIGQQIANSGSELPDSELIFEYPSTEDRRLVVSQSTTAPIFPSNKLTVKYPGLLEKINEDVAKFEWEGIEKSFPEWQGMTSTEAKTIMENSFEQWDKYKSAVLTNPQAKYLEYVVETPTTLPNIGGEATGIPSIGAPVIPTIPNMGNAANVPNVPTIPNVQNAQVTPGVAPVPSVAPAPAPAPQVAVPNPAVAPDPNSVFANGNGAAPTVAI